MRSIMAARKDRQRVVHSQNEEQSRDIDYVPPPEKPRQVSGLLRFAVYAFAVFTFLSPLFSGGVSSLQAATGYSLPQILFIMLFAVVFSELCAKMAAKIEKNLDFAWALGFLFGLFGFLVYWGYYRIVIARSGKTGKRGKIGRQSGKERATIKKR